MAYIVTVLTILCGKSYSQSWLT